MHLRNPHVHHMVHSATKAANHVIAAATTQDVSHLKEATTHIVHALQNSHGPVHTISALSTHAVMKATKAATDITVDLVKSPQVQSIIAEVGGFVARGAKATIEHVAPRSSATIKKLNEPKTQLGG